MELNIRKGSDAFVPPGSYKALQARLRQRAGELAEIPAVVLSCFDTSTRLLPFVLYDWMIFPCGARSVAAALHEAGFTRTRGVFQLWNRNFKPTQARLDGKPMQMFLVSTMQMHMQKAREAIRDAWSMGEDRPLILAGGSKAIYEPYHFWPEPGTKDPVAPDVVVSGEGYILLDLLNVVVQHRFRGESIRKAFERARLAGALDTVPGLVYLAPDADLHNPVLIDTGLQRLVQNFDELPDETVGLSLMETPHKGTGLLPQPLPDNRVRRKAMIASFMVTQGCKFNCPYCPIPAVNQKTWRYRSPENLVHQLKSVFERFGIKTFYGTDDNFFNRRQTAEEMLTAMARATAGGRPFKQKIRFGTEATQFDTWKNRDLLPVAEAGGVQGIWFGIEDLTAELINKGQKPEVTIELFKVLHKHKIAPMAMMMFHDGQPFYTPHSLYGLANQISFLRKAGAISVQCTVHTPAVGTREYENTYNTGRVIKKIGDYEVPEAKVDGNYVTVLSKVPAWKRQLQLLAGYGTFYNPLNLIRAFKHDGSRLRHRRIGYQIAGTVATIVTGLRTLPYTLRLMFSPVKCYQGPPPVTTVPVRLARQAYSRLPGEHLGLLTPPAKTKRAA